MLKVGDMIITSDKSYIYNRNAIGKIIAIDDRTLYKVQHPTAAQAPGFNCLYYLGEDLRKATPLEVELYG